MAFSVRQETLLGVKWVAIERFSLQGLQFLLGLIMARLLLPSDYGTVGLIGVFLAISQTFIDSGFSNALIRKIDRSEEDFVTVFYFNIVVAVICYALLFLIAPFVGVFFHSPILCSILRVLSLNLILNSFIGVHIAKLTININFKALAQRSLLSTVISGGFGIFFAYNGFGVWALVYQSLIATVINLLFIWIYCKWMPRGSFSKRSFHNLFSYGSKMLVAGLLNTLYGNLNTVVIGKFFSPNDLGFYSRGINLARFPIDNVNGVLLKATFPILSKIQNDDKKLILVYRKYIRIVSMCVFWGCMLLAAMGQSLILFLLTDKWKDSIIYLQIYCFAIMFDHISNINLNLLQVKGRSDLFLRLEVIKKCISTLILFSAIPFGVIGICISKIIYSQIAMFINTYYTGKLFHLGYMQQIKDFLPYWVLALISCSFAYAVSRMTNNYIVTLFVGTTLALGIYLSLLYFKKDESFMEFVLPQIKSIVCRLH